MTPKNIITGVIASAISLGSIFASSLFTPALYVKIGTTSTGSNCKSVIAGDCGAAGTRICEVRIISTGITYPTYLNSLCTNAITGSVQEPLESEFLLSQNENMFNL